MVAEFERKPFRGWPVLFILLAFSIANICALVWTIHRAVMLQSVATGWGLAWPIIAAALCLAILVFLWFGLFELEPNEAAVLVLFGAYKGTVSDAGFHYANPLYIKKKISLRARNLNGAKLKVNDQRGNPIEIAIVVVWRVEDTVKAVFEVDNYQDYVTVQSESAVRHLASAYPYDTSDEQKVSLRGNMDDIARTLRTELQGRLANAGVVVEEAWLSHLAYAPEIAGAMLRRQQAEAVVAARTRIVEGAVGMVQLALEHIERDGIVELDSERKASMVSNLLVVLCSEQGAHPVVNTGTLYS